MPFEAAKAVAATFCHPIRHALTPIFGKDFLTLCVPKGHPAFETFKIDRAIVRSCAAEAEAWRTLTSKSASASRSGTPLAPSSSSSSLSSCLESSVPTARSTTSPLTPKLLRPKTRKRDEESGYATGSDTDRYYGSPDVSPKTKPATSWTTVNTPAQSPETVGCDVPASYLSSVPRSTVVGGGGGGGGGQQEIVVVAPRTKKAKRPVSDLYADHYQHQQQHHGHHHHGEEEMGRVVVMARRSPEDDALLDRRRVAKEVLTDARAAYLLMQLSMGEGEGLPCESPRKKMKRASI